MEKDVSHHGPNRVYPPSRPSKLQKLIKVFLVIFVVGSLISISGRKTSLGAFTDPTSLNRLFGYPPSIPQNTASASKNDGYRLVSVHRVGVGKKRNQVYQVLDISNESPLHTSSHENGNYIISSMPRRTTHLADQTRQSTKNYITQSRLNKQALRDPLSVYYPQSPAAEWITRDIQAPNITDKKSVTTLAKVASNAYIRVPETDEWYDLGHKWNESTDFGWDEHGLRGHVFANADNSTVIVAMKGTSPPFVGTGDTSSNDKINVLLYVSVLTIGQHFIFLLLCTSILYLVNGVRLLYWRYI